MTLDHFPTPYTKINSKWIKDLNVRPETIKILEESTGNNFPEMVLSDIFLDMSPEARETEAKLNYWDYTKIKAFAQQRKPSTKQKRKPSTKQKPTTKPMEWKKIFANDITDKGLVCKTYKELIRLDT